MSAPPALSGGVLQLALESLRTRNPAYLAQQGAATDTLPYQTRLYRAATECRNVVKRVWRHGRRLDRDSTRRAEIVTHRSRVAARVRGHSTGASSSSGSAFRHPGAPNPLSRRFCRRCCWPASACLSSVPCFRPSYTTDRRTWRRHRR